MLLELADLLRGQVSIFHLFQYVTFRTIMSALTALVVALLLGPDVIRRLTAVKAGQVIRSDGPQTHLAKAGTPTMGGALILLAVAIATLLWADLHNRYMWIALGTMLAFGVIGFYDDYKKLVLRDSRGLAARWKYFWQSVCGFAAALGLYFVMHENSPAAMALYVPLFKQVAIPLGVVFIAVAYFIIVGFSNAVNLTDGLDGLAIMPTVLVASALGVFAYAAGNSIFSTYLQIPAVPGAGELCIFCGSLAGAGLGFLWFNAYPAQVFMGDTGSLALGGIIASLAIIVRKELLIPIFCFVFLVENLSVVIQVSYFKYTKRKYGEGKRIFLMSPLHHHYQKLGYHESKIAVRFWVVTILSVVFAVVTLKLR